MSSFALEEFVGNGVLRDQMDALQADGWDDVPTLKMMTREDMDTLQLSQLQRVSSALLVSFFMLNLRIRSPQYSTSRSLSHVRHPRWS